MKNELDSSAHMFASNRSIKNSATFRLSAVMRDEVDPALLQSALDETVMRYPMMVKKLRKGLFWYYFDNNDKKLLVQEEKDYPARMIDPDENGGYMIKVLYHANRISVETFHVITDGTGAGEFLKTLLYHYIRLKYSVEIALDEKILLPESLSEDEEEDSFRKYFLDKEGREKNRGEKAYLIKGHPYSDFGNNVTTLSLSASGLNAVAKKYGATITGFLASLMIEAVNECETGKKRRKRDIVIQIPVNLRKIFPSNTLRNFFGVANVKKAFYDPSTCDRKALVEDITRQLREQTERDTMAKMQKSNVALSTNPFSRITPLRLKNLFIPLGAKNMGETRKSVAISNYGAMRIPSRMREYIRVFEMVLYPTVKGPINIGIVSFSDRLAISMARNIAEKDIPRAFARKLSAILPCQCWSNSWGREDEEM